MKLSRLGNIQALRGMAVMAVVLSHLMSVERKYAGDRLLSDGFTVGFSGVDLFFAISGFVMVYVAWKSPVGPRTALSFLFARVGRIYPLYWLVSAVVLVFWLLRPDLVFSSNTEFSLLRSMTLWPDHNLPLLAVGWTLIHEMYFYLMFALLLLLAPRFRLWALWGWGAFVLIGFLGGVGGTGAVLQLVFHPLGFEFLGGALAALAYQRFDGRGWLWALGTGGVLFVLACALSLQLGTGFWETWPRAASFTPAVSLIVYGAVGAERAGKVLNRVLVWLGNQSYALYLSHVLSLSAAGRLWSYFAKDGFLDNMVMLPVALMIAVVAAEILHRVVEIPLLNAVKRLRRRLF